MQYTKDNKMATTNSGKPKSIAKRVPLKPATVSKAKVALQAQVNAANKKVTGNSVKVVPPTSQKERNIRNSNSTTMANNAKSGLSAAWDANLYEKTTSARNEKICCAKPVVTKMIRLLLR
jgi:hypothetical protein